LSIHQEITHFVHKFDLKQSQIARLAGNSKKNFNIFLYKKSILSLFLGVNQAYVSKFLRGDFSDLSENGKTLIYKWYLKYSKNPYMLTKHNNNNNNNNGLILFFHLF
jgi:predicted XRE-type DNA-binding protein